MKNLIWLPFIIVCIAGVAATVHSIYVDWTTPYPAYISCFEPESDENKVYLYVLEEEQ